MLTLQSCSDPTETQDTNKAATTTSAAVEDSPARQQYRVIERFDVGNNNFVRSLAVEEAKSSLWVGTSSGVHEIDLKTRQPLQTFTREHGLANEYVFAIWVDQLGYKWFGTNAGGVSRYKDGDWKTYFPMHGLADYWVYSFTDQQDGTLWIGTWAGANRVDARTGEFTTYVKELVNEWVYGLDVDSKDRVWFATEGGVSLYDAGKWSSWTHADGIGAKNDDGLPVSRNTGLGTRQRHDLGVMSSGQATYNPGYVFSIVAANDGTIWAGTWGGGVSQFDGTTWRNFTQKDGLAGNIVYSILQDSHGVLWFGTSRGVSRYDGSEWSTLLVGDSAAGNHIYTLVEDIATGEIWAGSRGAVVRIGQIQETTRQE